jgi:glutathione S-transferase
MLTLHHAWSSTCSQKVRLCLAEKGLAYEGRVLNLRRFEQLSPAFLALNPDGMVPVLVEDGLVLRESTVINDYLEDRFPEPALRPRDPAGRARVATWNRLVDEVASPAIKAPSFARNIAPALAGTDPDALEAALARMPDAATAGRWRRAARGTIAPEELAYAHDRLRLVLARMEAALAAHPWLAGEAYTLADVNMAPFILRLAGFPEYELSRDWPRVAAWMAALTARPAFAAARFVEQPRTMDISGETT